MNKAPVGDRAQTVRAAEPEAMRPEPVCIDSRALFAGRAEICIAHEDAVYRPRITRAGKLILTK
jgi:hemin uptake protein HemP